jgi:5,10-methylenetetrahydromethanopterin reductase
MQGKAAGPQNEVDSENFGTVRRTYDMTKHGSLTESKRLIGESLTPEFVKRFAIVGPPDRCTERLLELVHRGLDRLHIVGPGFYPDSWGDARHLFTREVIPSLRAEVLDPSGSRL